MARYDKYDPVDGGFRAPLAAEYTGSEDVVGVGLNANGQVVPGEGETGIVGVMVKVLTAAAGDIVDVMTDGEIVEFDGASGTVYKAEDNGTVSAAGADGDGTHIGHTVEASRLIVRVQPGTEVGGAG